MSLVAGVTNLATGLTQVDHNYGWGLVIIGVIAILAGGMIFLLPSAQNDDGRRITKALAEGRGSIAQAAGRDIINVQQTQVSTSATATDIDSILAELRSRFTIPTVIDGRLCKGISHAWLFHKVAPSLPRGIDSRYVSSLSTQLKLDATVDWLNLFSQWNIDGLVDNVPVPGPSSAQSIHDLRSDQWRLAERGKLVAKALQDSPPAEPEFYP